MSATLNSEKQVVCKQEKIDYYQGIRERVRSYLGAMNPFATTESTEQKILKPDACKMFHVLGELREIKNGASDEDEPDSLLCPITMCIYKDPVFVAEPGNTYERDALLTFWDNCEKPRDPFTNAVLSDTSIFTNWSKRREVQSFLETCQKSYIPSGWITRTPPPPSGRNFQCSRVHMEENYEELIQKNDMLGLILVVLCFWSIYAVVFWALFSA
jgi:hypothetical protein